MRGSRTLKILAALLAVCSILLAVASGIGVFLLADARLYRQPLTQWEDRHREGKAESLAQAMAESYAARILSDFSTEQLQVLGWGNDWQTNGRMQGVNVEWHYCITRQNRILESTCTKEDLETAYTFQMQVAYPKTPADNSAMKNSIRYYNSTTGRDAVLHYVYGQSPEYTVSVWLPPEYVPENWGITGDVYRAAYSVRYPMIGVLTVCSLLIFVSLGYLIYGAGVRKDGTVRLVGLNRLPLDLYGCVTAAVSVFIGAAMIVLVKSALMATGEAKWLWIALSLLPASISGIIFIGFCWAAAAQYRLDRKEPWRRSLIGRLATLCWRVLCKLAEVLPVVWQYWAIALGMAAGPLFFTMVGFMSHGFIRFCCGAMLFFCLALDMGLVLYGGYAFGTVLKGARKMAAGELRGQVNTQFLLGSYRRCGEDLNSLAEVAMVAAGEQMRSERMKTELITNVSHDIKTPLTSIINYVDLLQKTEDPEEQKKYLQVLERQSLRMKKLLEDLVDMSRATTGDMPVEIDRLDLTEAVTQALGEFSDKLEQQGLQVVTNLPQKPVAVMADGRLTWRVLSNLLSNAVKYSLPGTRVYVDLLSNEQGAVLSIKNISGTPLNISAQELTERFVRGDASRNSEGSGLGLNIAQSLMQLQMGKLELLVDGDLFKVTLTFPA